MMNNSSSLDTPRTQDLNAPDQGHINNNTSLGARQEHFHMSLVMRKPVFGVSDQVRHKPGCAAKEDG